MAKAAPAKAQLDRFIDRYTPEVAARARAVLERMRERLPGATELVYDNYNALAIGFGPGEKVSEAVFSVALYPRWVSLFFLHGAELPDPAGVLKGSGSQVRHIVLDDAADLERPEIRTLMDLALGRAGWTPQVGAPHSLVIKSISVKQRPRTPR